MSFEQPISNARIQLMLDALRQTKAELSRTETEDELCEYVRELITDRAILLDIGDGRIHEKSVLHLCDKFRCRWQMFNMSNNLFAADMKKDVDHLFKIVGYAQGVSERWKNICSRWEDFYKDQREIIKTQRNTISKLIKQRGEK